MKVKAKIYGFDKGSLEKLKAEGKIIDYTITGEGIEIEKELTKEEMLLVGRKANSKAFSSFKFVMEEE